MNITKLPADPTAISSAAANHNAKASGKPSKIHEAAQQFESLMINEMLKTVKESSSSGWLGGEGDSGADSTMEMAQAQFANALAKNGGLGLARMIEKSISPAAPHPATKS